ncbi:hypothetical protein TWF281_010874 [Arthrobotrys megalospora]
MTISLPILSTPTSSILLDLLKAIDPTDLELDLAFQWLQEYIHSNKFPQISSAAAPSSHESPSACSDLTDSAPSLSPNTESTTPSSSPPGLDAYSLTTIVDTLTIVGGIPKTPKNLTLYALIQYSYLSEDYSCRKTETRNPPTRRVPKNRKTSIERPRGPQHECPKCQAEYHGGRDFMAHFHNCTGYPLFSCAICKERFARDDFWQGHFRTAKHKKKEALQLQALTGTTMEKRKKKKTKAAGREADATRRPALSKVTKPRATGKRTGRKNTDRGQSAHLADTSKLS